MSSVELAKSRTLHREQKGTENKKKGCWSLVTGHWAFVTDHWSLDIGYWFGIEQQFHSLAI